MSTQRISLLQQCTRTWVGKIVTVLFGGIFGALFLLLSYTQWHGLYIAQSSASWMSHTAVLNSWSIEQIKGRYTTNGRRTTDVGYYASYSYVYNHKTYTATRIRPVSYSSNADKAFNDRLHQIFTQAEKNENKLQIWIDPTNPEQSLVLRDVSVVQSAFMCLFLIFPCGLGSLLMLFVCSWLLQKCGIVLKDSRVFGIWSVYIALLACMSLYYSDHYLENLLSSVFLMLVGIVGFVVGYKMFRSKRIQSPLKNMVE